MIFRNQDEFFLLNYSLPTPPDSFLQIIPNHVIQTQ